MTAKVFFGHIDVKRIVQKLVKIPDSLSRSYAQASEGHSRPQDIDNLKCWHEPSHSDARRSCAANSLPHMGSMNMYRDSHKASKMPRSVSKETVNATGDSLTGDIAKRILAVPHWPLVSATAPLSKILCRPYLQLHLRLMPGAEQMSWGVLATMSSTAMLRSSVPSSRSLILTISAPSSSKHRKTRSALF